MSDGRDRRDEIRQRWAKVASRIPWHVGEGGGTVLAADGATVATHSVDGWFAGSGPELEPDDADAIAHAPEDVAWLLAELDRLDPPADG